MRRPSSQLAEAHDEDPVLHIEARQIRHARAGGVVWFDFQDPVWRAALAERLP
jgi:cell division protein ZapE